MIIKLLLIFAFNKAFYIYAKFFSSFVFTEYFIIRQYLSLIEHNKINLILFISSNESLRVRTQDHSNILGREDDEGVSIGAFPRIADFSDRCIIRLSRLSGIPSR